MHTSGVLASYGGMGFTVNDRHGPYPERYDASAYTGVRFFAKGFGTNVRLEVHSIGTQTPQFGGTCNQTRCVGNRYALTSLSSTTWTEITVPFLELKDGSATFRAADLLSIQLVIGAGSFDVWMDDIRFY